MAQIDNAKLALWLALAETRGKLSASAGARNYPLAAAFSSAEPALAGVAFAMGWIDSERLAECVCFDIDKRNTVSRFGRSISLALNLVRTMAMAADDGVVLDAALHICNLAKEAFAESDDECASLADAFAFVLYEYNGEV